MKAFFRLIRREPVLAMNSLYALIALFVAFGAKLTTQQIEAIVAFAVAVLALGGGIVRGAVQPLSKMEPQQAVQVLEQAKADDAKP